MLRFLFMLALAVGLAFTQAFQVNAQTNSYLSTTPDIPRTLSYQGDLRSNNGKPIQDGDYTITIRLYSDPAGITKIWEGVYKTKVQNGIFNLMLGEGKNAFPASEMMNSPLWTGIQIGNTPELKPLTPLSASAYALNVANNSITKEKMATDYVGSISLNGEKISGKGADVNIIAGNGLHASVDPGTNSVLLSAEHSFSDSKGGQISANTTITGTLNVTLATSLQSTVNLNTLSGQTNIGSNSSSVPGVINLAQGSSSGHTASLHAPPSMAGDLILNLPGLLPNENDVLTANSVSGNTVTLGWSTPTATGLMHFEESLDNANHGSGSNNGTRPVAGLSAVGTSNTIDVMLAPKSDGALQASSSDGSVANGAKRGSYATDWQRSRSTSTQVASATFATIGGGFGNAATGAGSTISGGGPNTASNNGASVGGGANNHASGYVSTIAGGEGNVAGGVYDAIPGGVAMFLNGSGCFGFQAKVLQDDNVNVRSMHIDADNTSVFGNTDLWLANNDGNARALFFYAPHDVTGPFNSTNYNFPGTSNPVKYTGFKAGEQTTSVIYTLPLADGTSGQVLKTDGTGILSWVTPHAVLDHFVESYDDVLAQVRSNPVAGLTATGEASVIDIMLAPQNDGALQATLSDGTVSGGIKRGRGATDWQRNRQISGEVASGSHSTISGGAGNVASGLLSTVSGGGPNSASNQFATVGGGALNRVLGYASTAAGGINNVPRGDCDAIPGGTGLTLNGDGCFGFLGSHFVDNHLAQRPMYVDADFVSVFGNTDLWLANNDGAARALYFYAPHNITGVIDEINGKFPSATNPVKYTAFKAGEQTASVIYTLPLADGAGGAVLSTNGLGVLSWQDGASIVEASGWTLTGNTGTSAGTNFIGTTDAADLVVKTNDNEQFRVLATGGVQLPATAPSGQGILFQDGARLLHTYGTHNFFAGTNSGNTSMSGTENTATGYSALSANTTGDLNTAEGFNALKANTSGFQNTAIGSYALASVTSGEGNTAVGYATMWAGLLGKENTALGRSALHWNSTGNGNTATGYDALMNTTSGGYNTATGWLSLQWNVNGIQNTASGNFALDSNTTGSRNAAFGDSAGTTNWTGSDNTFVGGSSNASTHSLANATAIGARALVGADNSLVLGSIAGVNSAAASTSVGIGTTTPAGVLDVVSTTGALIVPRMSTADRLALPAVKGSIVYDTDLDQFFRFGGSGGGTWSSF